MNDPIIAIALAPLILGLILSQSLRLSVRAFQGVYMLLVAGATGISYFYLNMGYIAPLVAGAAGLVVMMITMGFVGTKIRSSDYALIEFGIGLFPWTLGLTTAIIYSVIFAGFATLIALRPKFKNPFKRFR